VSQAEYYDQFTEAVFSSYFPAHNPCLSAARKLCKVFVLPGDRVLEIGCGVGVIAKSLVPRAEKLSGHRLE